MSDVSQVVAQMMSYGMPSLPPNHPILDGKYKRFGPKKAAWYILREMTLRSGRVVVTGAFGFFQGENRNTVPVTMDMEELTEEERVEYTRQQRATEQAEADKKERDAELAANRARDQWNKAEGVPLDHPYLVRKQIAPEGVRVSPGGLLLVPMARAGKLVGLQKIDKDGGKKYSTDMDAAGAALVLGRLAGAPVIACGEGYATCASARQSVSAVLDLPTVVAFTAGGIMAVALRLRKERPDAHLLLLADDDYLLAERFVERLREDFKVSVAVPIDGATHVVQADDGESVEVLATWRADAQGIPYIDADMRKGRLLRSPTFKNAGVSSCHAAAKAVGNATVAMPLFADRGGRKLNDWNDLWVEEGRDAVTAQLSAFILVAQQFRADSPVPTSIDAEHLPGEAAAPDASASPTESSPRPPLKAVAPEMLGQVTLEWALAHCALVQGSTNVWDALNKLLMKRAAFVAIAGKDTVKEWEAHAARRSISPRVLPRTVRGVAQPTEGSGEEHIAMMLDRYTLLYGTKTVWDAYKKTILGFDAMALARGNDLASRWISHPLHQEKDLDKLVFDPTQRVNLDTHINMFEGFLLKPKADEEKAGLVLDLLYSLCSSEANCDDVFKWVLCWLAYPLQHPGAKMQTALLFFGEKQGTGKSLFFEGIVKPIYGTHGATGGQHQLESTYTMWRSQKLFVLFEEILSRQDKYSYFGLIKHMITGRDSSISQKFKDDRTEANHLNVVMLSNEFQAVPIEPEDRRFLVVDVKLHPAQDLIDKIKAVLDKGLIEAFYDFLLNYPLGDFDPHSKPLMTPSKERVINFGRPDWEAFYMAWAAGDLMAPYCSCLSEDLHYVYSRYCTRYGFKSLSITRFSELIAQRVAKERKWVTIGLKKKQFLMVFVVPQEEEETLNKQIERFRTTADIKEMS